jgi:hypothetical protein
VFALKSVKKEFASRFTFATSKSGVAQAVLYYVCIAITYKSLFDWEISQIIRFFLTQNQSTVVLLNKLLIPSSSH